MTADKTWWIGTGYEVCEPIQDIRGGAELLAAYTPGNGIRLSVTEFDQDAWPPMAPEDRYADFDLEPEQARWLALKLLAWADHNHSLGGPRSLLEILNDTRASEEASAESRAEKDPSAEGGAP